MEKRSLQIQTVLYQNDKQSLYTSLESLKRAVEISAKEQGAIEHAVVWYGDASPSPLFSPQQTEALRARYAPALEVQYVFFGFNSGTSKGHNLLAERCEAEYLLVMNPDVIVCPRFFCESMKPFAREDVGIVEGRQTPLEHPKAYDPQTGETAWASGACMLLPSALYHKAGGFDAESFFLYCDDVDLSWRVRLLNKKIIYQPLAPVFHAKRLSASAQWQPTAAERYYSAEAALLMAHKWSNPQRVAYLLSAFLDSTDEDLQKAAQAFQSRKTQGTLPTPLDPQHRVATFVGDNYTKHRF